MKRLILCCMLLLTGLLFAQELTYHIPDAVTYEVPYEFDDSFYQRGFHEEIFFFQYQLEDSNLNVNQFTMNSDMEFSEIATIATIPITTEIASLNDLYTYFRWFADGSFHLILSSIDKGYEWGFDHEQYYNVDLTDQQFFLEYALRFLNTGELYDTININELYPGYYYRASGNFDKLIIASAGFNSETSHLFFQNHVYSIDTQNLEFWKNGNITTPIIINGYYIDFFYGSEYQVYNDQLELLYTNTEIPLFDLYTPMEVINYCFETPIFAANTVMLGDNRYAVVYHFNEDYSISSQVIESDELITLSPGVFFHYWHNYNFGYGRGVFSYNQATHEWRTNYDCPTGWIVNFVSNGHIISYGEETNIFDEELNIVASFDEVLGNFGDSTSFYKAHYFEKFGYYLPEDNAYILTELEIMVNNENVDLIPLNISLENYPNPFNPETTISYSIPVAGVVTVDIYNLLGQKVRTLVDGHKEAGKHSVVWNGTNKNKESLSSGIYFYRMKSGKFSSTKKMILMKQDHLTL